METTINHDEKINILLVDDSPENLFTLESILEKTTRTFLHAESGNEALMMAKIEPVGLILLDFRMPDMDGIEVANQLRDHETTKHIPIIFVSAVSRSERKKFRCFAEGTIDLLPKPIDLDDARTKVELFEQIYFLRKLVGVGESVRV